MQRHHVSPLLGKALLLSALTILAACTEVEQAYDSAYSTIVGEEETTPVKKVTVTTPAAAPVQPVDTVNNSTAQTVELGSMSDDASLTAPPKQVWNAQPVVTTPATEQPVVAAHVAADTQQPLPTAAPQAVSEPAPPPQVSAPAAAPQEPLLTIRFNQPHVYYDEALKGAVNMAEAAKPGVHYDVLSTVPDLTVLPQEQQQLLRERAQNNLRSVVMKMQQQGVDANRIRIADQTLRIRSQEIQVFVQ